MLEVGQIFEIKKIVNENETADKVGSGALKVFSTPMMLALMENCAMEQMKPLVKEEESSVGISVNNLKHLRANLVGDELICKSKITSIDGRKVGFHIEVMFNEEIIGSCEHERFIVNIEKFLSKLNK